MQKQTENPCIRCGKTRIVDKIWTEYEVKILITHTKMVCPDSDCQKIVEAEIAARIEKRELLTRKHGASANKQIKISNGKQIAS